MEKLSWFQKLLGVQPRQWFCAHGFVAMFTADAFIIKGYERCSGAATCYKCGAYATVHVSASELERNEFLGKY